MYLLASLLLAVTPSLSAPPADSLLIELNGRVTVVHTADFAALPRDSVRWSEHGTSHMYSGVRLTDLVKRVGVPMDSLHGHDLTKRVVVEAADHYRVVFALGELAPGIGSRMVLVADEQDGQPLPPAAGPLRLIVPADGKGARCVRQVIALRVRDEL
jgi:DMSO/TMAO reductase YedYZ molybdopterin-dependent catalytic subunit